MMRLLPAFTLAAALLGLLTIVACGGEEGEELPASAVGEGTPAAQITAAPGEGTPAAQVTATPAIPEAGAIEMGIDPETTGNTCGPSPADCTLGTVESCYAITCPSEECTWDGSSSFDGTSDYVIDVYVDDPAGGAPAPVVYDAWVYYDEAIVHIAAPGTNGKIKMPGADFQGGAEANLPDTGGRFNGGWMFMSAIPNPGVDTYLGDGPLLRLGLDIGASGLVTFSLDELGSSYLSMASGGWPNIESHPLTFQTAQLAINQDCPEE
jgi:hypothetical protein